MHCRVADAQLPPSPAPGAPTQARRFELTWDAPLGCPSHAELTREVEGLIADTSGVSRAAPIFASASITQEPDGFALKLTLRDIEAERVRRIGAPTCEELGHAAALIVAIAVDPTILERRVDPPATGNATNACSNAPKLFYCRLRDLPAAVNESRAASQPDVAAPPQTRSDPTMNEPLRWRAGLGLFGSIGILPGLYPGLNILGALQSNAFRFELNASMLNARVEDEAAGRGANFSLYRASPRACLLWTEARWAAGPCGGVRLGRISGTGYGVPNSKTQSAFWGETNLGATVELRLSASSLLSLGADLGLPWWRDDFQLLGRSLHQPSRLSANLGVNLSTGWR